MSGAAMSGQFRIGGELTVNRLGFGALWMTGPDFWGEPADCASCLELLRALPELGVNLIDTADSYGPESSERTIREGLHPYPEGLVIATKGGYLRPRPGAWVPCGRPEYLIHTAKLSARRLGVERIDLWQLHRIDPRVPRDEQFDALRALRDEGVIRCVGLSEVSVEDVEAAQAVFPVATVQNLYNLANRQSEAVLDYCEAQGIGFMPWYPLGQGALLRPGSRLCRIAETYGASPSQIAIAWLLRRSPVMLPIPGTSRLAHLRENVAAAAIALSDEDYAALSTLAEPPMRQAAPETTPA
jgi:pyridoxine 4-dehydrogenase